VNELALFAGAGGGILGGHLLGWRTVCAVEWEQYPASVLCARQNDKILPPFPIWDDVQTFDGEPWRGIVDVVSGGFPCQDISVAGKGDGLDGERSGMWREMARIIGEVRPRFAFVENSPMLVNRGLERVLADLTSMGYDSRWGVISAADVGAPHLRERIWILATDTSFQRCNEWGGNRKERHFLHNINRDASQGESKRQGRQRGVGEIGSDVADTNCKQRGIMEVRRTNSHDCEQRGDVSRIFDVDQRQLQKQTEQILADTPSIGQQGQGKYEQSLNSKKDRQRQTNYAESIGRPQFWAVEPNVGRVANGVAARVDRLKAIGNGQVPLCAATAWELLK